MEETFLLIVVIILLIIFNSAKNAKLKRLEDKLSQIEKYLRSLQFQQPVQTQVTEQQKATPQADKIPPVVAPVIPPKQEPVIQVPKPTDNIPTVIPPLEQKPVAQPEVMMQQPVQKPVVKPPVPKEGWYERFRKNNPDLEKFIGENILSKVAITILVLGVAFFVKFAIDNNWINEIARTGIGILCGAIVMVFAHHLHKRFKAFSSVLVAGAIAIFYFTIGIAFHEYHIFSQTMAFVLMLVITGFSVFISVLYDRIELATLSLIGGFATPFMVSTGQGNYLVLFTYVLILDTGMLVLAYLRKWNLINILAYVFTTLLFAGWLETKVIGKPGAPYKGALIFAGVFYVMFILMNIINNIKEKRRFGAIELSMLISNTFVFYGLGMQVLSWYHPELKGAFSGLIAAFNLVCSWLLFRKFKADEKLVYLMIGLTLTFITLIAPVQLHGNYITIFWALESVLLIWLAQRSGIVLYRFASVIITILMGISLVMDWFHVYIISGSSVSEPLFMNKAFITGFVSSLSLLAVLVLLSKEKENSRYLGIEFNPKRYGSFLTVVFVVVLYLTGLLELIYQTNEQGAYGATIAVSLGVYHFVFFALLNMAANLSKQAPVVTTFVFNYINAGLYVLVFAYMPLLGVTDNLTKEDAGDTAFFLHYFSLAAFGFILWQMRRAILLPSSPVAGAKGISTILMALAVVYILSFELLAHGVKLTVDPVIANDMKVIYAKTDEYQAVEKHIIQVGFPILWGLLAFAFLFIGMKKQIKLLRVMALIIIAITLLKLFTYDIKDASQAGKIVAFIILGVVLLIISFMYQKIKTLLLDDDKKEEVGQTNN